MIYRILNEKHNYYQNWHQWKICSQDPHQDESVVLWMDMSVMLMSIFYLKGGFLELLNMPLVTCQKISQTKKFCDWPICQIHLSVFFWCSSGWIMQHLEQLLNSTCEKSPEMFSETQTPRSYTCNTPCILFLLATMFMGFDQQLLQIMLSGKSQEDMQVGSYEFAQPVQLIGNAMTSP